MAKSRKSPSASTRKAAAKMPVDLGPDNWIWGPDDQLGAGNRMTTRTILGALQKVQKGEIIDLSHDVAQGAPSIPPIQSPYVMTVSSSAQNSERFIREALGAENGIGFYLERIEMTTHVSTHIDALGHATIHAELYGGIPAPVGADDFGLRHCGIEKAPPFFTRGVVLDVAAVHGVAHLDPGYAITPADLEAALKRQKVRIPKAAIVLIHTGWGAKFWSEPVKYAHGYPGIGLAASKWLAAKEVVAVGADNMALEVWPCEDPKVIFPVHQHLITRQGIYIIENVKTDAMVSRGLWEATIVILPTKFRGATGAPVRIVAML
ncbi:MAG: cyclase family protein [Gammaproteobacteria bacterium]